MSLTPPGFAKRLDFEAKSWATSEREALSKAGAWQLLVSEQSDLLGGEVLAQGQLLSLQAS